MEREELERYTEQWLRVADAISDDEYGEIVNDYLQTHSYKWYKYQNPGANEESLVRFTELLTNQTLWLSAPSVFNDPFDCQFAIPNNFTDVSRAQKAIKSTNDTFFRVGCLTETYDNRLMWSHYGGSYRGVCVEYDVSNFSAVQTASYFAPVIYKKERPEILERIISSQSNKFSLTPEEKLTMTRALYTKDEVWKYEREWRILKMNHFSERLKHFPLTMSITAVYLGPACSDNLANENINPENFKKHLSDILDICEKNKIKLQMLKLHPTYYQLKLSQRLV